MSLFEEIDCKTVFEHLPISSWIVDYDTLQILNVNTMAIKLYGYPKSEFKKLYIWNLDADGNKKKLLRKVKKLKKLKHFSFKTKHITKDKELLDVIASVNIITVKDKKFFNVTCQNNTHELKVERKLDYFEKKFEFFFNQLPEAILIIDQNLENIVNANRAATELLGYCENELNKINFSTILHHNSENCRDIIRDKLDNKENFFERRVQKKDGKTIDTLVSFKKLNSPYGINLIITCRDITAQKHEELQLKELNESLKKNIDIKIEELHESERILLEQSKLAQMGEMLNMIAHQWRQPLNSISAAAMNMAFKQELDLLDEESVQESSQFIQNETQRMSQIINDFMEFNKSETNRDFPLYKATQEVIKMITPQLKNRSISLDVDIDKELCVFHNIKSIEHVLLNLITNAKDEFENKNKIKKKKIKIYATSDDKTIILHVEDNAGGIKNKHIHKVFNPYFTTKDQGKGTGIGLYMSKRMVESVLGSTLSVKNSDDGAIFSITFKK